MSENLNILTTIEMYLPLLFILLGTFIVGYATAYFLVGKQYQSQISKLKSEVNSALSSSQINNIDTIFTEIKPKIVDILKETQHKNADPLTTPIPQKAKTTYVSYAKHKPTLDFESIGEANKNIPDDLTQINGIGPYIEQRLNEIGIYNYHQISNLKIADIRMVTDLIELFPKRIEDENWVEQAKTLTILEKNKSL